MTTVHLLQIAGVLHLGLMAAGLVMPSAVGLRAHIRTLPEFIRSLLWVYYTFIGLCLVGFGALSFFLAEELASGTPLARAVCGFLAVFWGVRLAAAVWVLDVGPYLRNPLWKLGYHATNAVFALLPLLYAYVALAGGS